MDFIYLPILLFTVLMIISILTSLFSARSGIPLLLVFIFIGVLASAGSLAPLFTQLQHPKIVFFIGSVALALILFDSGFHTPMKSYKSAMYPSILLATIGVILGAVIMTPIVKYALETNWMSAALLSSMISSTDAAAVFFLLRSQGIVLKKRVQSTLEVESGANDPMAIFLTFGVIMLIQQQETGHNLNWFLLGSNFFAQLFIGGGAGFLLFKIMNFSLNHVKLEQALYPLFTLGLAMTGFALTSMIGGSGYLALYIAGLLLGNSKIQAKATISKFQQTISWLSQILMFTILGIFVTPAELKNVLIPGLILGTSLIFIGRPLMIFMLLIFFKNFTFKDKCFISFVGLRGATSILLALAPIVYNIPGAESFFNIIFIMVLYSLSFQGLLIPFTARLFKVILPCTLQATERVEIDLPGLNNSSLMMYELCETSPVILGQSIPRWAQPVLLIRNHVIYQTTKVSEFRPGDKVYVFVPSEHRLPLLDQLYGNDKAKDALGVFGDFPISPSTTFDELQKMYGIQVDLRLLEFTVADLIQKEFPDMDVGDRLSLDSIELVVRSIKNGEPTSIGIDIDPSRRKSTFYARANLTHLLGNNRISTKGTAKTPINESKRRFWPVLSRKSDGKKQNTPAKSSAIITDYPPEEDKDTFAKTISR